MTESTSTAGTGDVGDQPWDFIVVGAGMAGLYFAYRYLGKHPNTRILILEMLDRTGGRLDTDIVYVNNVPVKNEEGGMRFTMQMSSLIPLLRELGLFGDIMDFSMGDEHNIYNVRTRKFTFGDAVADPLTWSRIYSLKPEEIGKQPNMILQGVFNQILKDNGAPADWYPSTPGEWQDVRLNYQCRGIKLFEWGFWALLVDYGLSQECMDMIEDSMGFLAFYDQSVNAGVGFQTMGDFDKLPEYKTLRSGYETLSDKLAGRVTALGGQIKLDQRVLSFTVNPANLLTTLVAAVSKKGIPAAYVCDKLILALPKLPLELLLPYSPMIRDNPQLVQNIQSVVTMPLTKVNLYFTERWWFNRYQISAGGSFTDIPMGQFYCYWPYDPADRHGPASMTIYCDFDRTTYWEELQALGTPFPPVGVTQPATSTAASTFVVEQAMRQLRTFFKADDLPEPVLSTYVRWGTPSFGDGDHSWVPGANDKIIMEQMYNPVPDRVYICGEAYSDDQAWVNGALRSVEALLAKHFGIPAP